MISNMTDKLFENQYLSSIALKDNIDYLNQPAMRLAVNSAKRYRKKYPDEYTDSINIPLPNREN